MAEDECSDTYGRCRMYQALKLKYPQEDIPSERTVYRIMAEIGLVHKPNRKPNGITKAGRDARKSDDLFKRDFTARKPFEKCVTDITEIPVRDGKLYVSAIFDSYDLSVLGLAMADNMKAELCVSTAYTTKKMTIEALKTLIWRYFIIYWNTRRICSANGGLPPLLKRKQYDQSLEQVA